jgi:N-acetylmuramic acid 6-phosphate etherase
VLKQIDLDALDAVSERAGDIDRLSLRVKATLDAGRRVFLCGCGATGRLALSLEFCWRQVQGDDDRVLSFMAGGDVALVHSLEGFEDHPAYGGRHLMELGFADGDLLISCTEGGETPYVIGATEKAALVSANPPFFLYCNPDSILASQVARFRRVYKNQRIEKICLDVGPMALAGSTRMQASTVLQLAVGLALLNPGQAARDAISGFRARVSETDFSMLAALIEKESEIYSAGHHVTYRVRDFGITVFTDTTERAPTFSLVPFDQLRGPRSRPSLCYVALDDAAGPAEAWTHLLNRTPRPLDWPEVDRRTTAGYMNGFDFSVRAARRRQDRIPHRKHHDFSIKRSRRGIELRLDGVAQHVPTDGMPVLFQHLLLKQMLNIHSTLVMGRLGRYQDNLMTWVTPTNRKLVDRAVRYIGHLLSQAAETLPRYETIVHQLFFEMDRVRPDESIVLRTCRSLQRARATGMRAPGRPSAPLASPPE